MKLLAIDPSGNHGKEGYGITGFCIMEDGAVKSLLDIKAKDYETQIEYWVAIADFIEKEFPDHITCEGYRLYNHKGMKASTQANSDLETPQLLGIIKLVAYRRNIPLTVQYASEIKTRWSEDVLVRLGILELKGNKHYWNGQSTVTHHRDSLKHALHYWRYKHEK